MQSFLDFPFPFPKTWCLVVETPVRLITKRLLMAGLLACLALPTHRLARAQEICRGDVNDDGVVDGADALALPDALFDAEGVDSQTAMRADANDDGVVSAGDFVGILRLNGFPCGGTPTLTPTTRPPPTPTPTPTFLTPTATVATATPTPTRPTATPTATFTGPSPTPTQSPTPTFTFTPRPTATPTPTCIVQILGMGSLNGELTTSDCQRQFATELRYTDVYSVVGVPGQAIQIAVTATAAVQPIVPFISVFDAAGEFGLVEGSSPVEFVATTAQPYLVYVTSQPTTTQQLGTYQVSASSRPCPTPVALTIPTTRSARLDGTECPDPGNPSTGVSPNPVDLYTFLVTQVPTNLQILMRQTNANDSIDPVFDVIGPDGYELFSPDQDDDAAPPGGFNFGTDAGAHFLATVPGLYTVIAGGNGELGAYSLALSSPLCTAKPLGTIPSTSPLSKTGQLFGDTTKTTCAGALPIPEISDDVPEPNTGADLYTFTAQAGDVVSIEMDSDDDAHLFLYGPSSAGNPRVAQDDDSGTTGIRGNSQLAATLALPGTYTIVATNNNALLPPDPTVLGDTGDIVNYTLYVQKCPVAGALTAGEARASTFTTIECVGFGGLPFRSYAYTGSAGQFVNVSMTSPDVDAAVRLLGPDGSQIYNDNDLFDSSTTDARLARILPVDGTYFVEVSSSLSSGPVDLSPPPPGFTVQVQTCPTVPAVPGTVAGAFQDADCELTPGWKYDVYTFAGPAAPGQQAVSLLPPTNGCLVGLYAEGVQVPGNGCSADLLEMPTLTSGTYGFIVAANDNTVRGNYAVQFRNCPLSTVNFGDSRNGSLSSNSCSGADGAAADWYLLRGAADVVRFNSGISGTLTPGFPGLLTDAVGGETFDSVFQDDPDSMLPFGTSLAALIKVAGPTPGNYTLSIDPATLRQ